MKSIKSKITAYDGYKTLTHLTNLIETLFATFSNINYLQPSRVVSGTCENC